MKLQTQHRGSRNKQQGTRTSYTANKKQNWTSFRKKKQTTRQSVRQQSQLTTLGSPGVRFSPRQLPALKHSPFPSQRPPASQPAPRHPTTARLCADEAGKGLPFLSRAEPRRLRGRLLCRRPLAPALPLPPAGVATVQPRPPQPALPQEAAEPDGAKGRAARLTFTAAPAGPRPLPPDPRLPSSPAPAPTLFTPRAAILGRAEQSSQRQEGTRRRQPPPTSGTAPVSACAPPPPHGAGLRPPPLTRAGELRFPLCRAAQLPRCLLEDYISQHAKEEAVVPSDRPRSTRPPRPPAGEREAVRSGGCSFARRAGAVPCRDGDELHPGTAVSGSAVFTAPGLSAEVRLVSPGRAFIRHRHRFGPSALP